MFGHDNHDNDHDDKAQGAPMPPDPMPIDDSSSTSTEAPTPVSTDNPSSDGDSSSPADNLMPTPAVDTPPNDDLLNIKQQALQQLTPLVGHLDQTPEEKFRTTMMMIQGADNQGLIKDAYAAAQQITDEKARAQALLDIVNEINYFTQHTNS